jgi:hypothetical protein
VGSAVFCAAVIATWIFFPKVFARSIKGGMFPLGAGYIDGLHPFGPTAVF